MSVYVGIDVHRKRSQVAVVDQAGQVLANRNVPNGAEPILSVIGDLPIGTPVAFEAAFGWGWLVELLDSVSTSSSSSRSPAVTSFSVPPFAATRMAARPRWPVERTWSRAGRSHMHRRRRPNPSGSRPFSMLRASAHALTPEAASHRTEGRTRSARIIEINPIESRSSRCRAWMSWSSSQEVHVCFQADPVVSAPCRRGPGPLLGLTDLLGVMGQHPPHHFLLAWGQVELRGGRLGMTEHELHVGERQRRVLGHPVGRGVAAAHATSPRCPPAGSPAQTFDARRDRSAAVPGGAASTTRLPAAGRDQLLRQAYWSDCR
jgi:hypothetical protein